MHEYLKETHTFFEAPQTRAMPTFVFRCDFTIGLGKPKLYTKFRFARFSHYRNTKRDPQIFGSSRSPELRPLFSVCGFVMSLGKPQLRAKLEVASFSRCRNIKGEAANFGELP